MKQKIKVIVSVYLFYRNLQVGASLVVQQLGLCISTAGAMSSIPGLGN